MTLGKATRQHKEVQISISATLTFSSMPDKDWVQKKCQHHHIAPTYPPAEHVANQISLIKKTPRNLFLILPYPFQLPAAQAQFLFNQVSFCLSRLRAVNRVRCSICQCQATLAKCPHKCFRCSSHLSNVNSLFIELFLSDLSCMASF